MATAEISEQAEAGGPGSDHRNSSKTTRISWRICRSPDPSTIHGFDKELMLVGNLFQRNEDDVRFKAIGIVGVQGIGKSTLCRKLLEAPEFKTDYLPRIWVSVSRECTDGQDRKAALVKRILLCLGFEEEKLESIPGNGNLEDLLYVLHLQLTGKRYLIVLDDVNESEDWLTNLNCPPPNRSESHLADGLPKNGGGRVIVTSRSSAVAKAIVGEKNVHQLLPFSDPENFSKIYEQEVKTLWSESDLEYFNDPEVKQALLDKCRGLPFYAKMLAEEKKLRDEEQKLKDEEKKKLHKR